ncbi:hypothetical protein BgiBS90_023926, partial [Biomphalaria glabrata]
MVLMKVQRHSVSSNILFNEGYPHPQVTQICEGFIPAERQLSMTTALDIVFWAAVDVTTMRRAQLQTHTKGVRD